MRVVIAEDEALLREGVALLLERDGMQIVGSAADAPELMTLVADHHPDVVVTDIRMPPDHTDDGLRAAIQIRTRYPDVAVMVLSQFVQRRYALELLAGGTSHIGYLLKQRVTDGRRFCAELRAVAAGGTTLDPDVVEALVARANRPDGRLEGLTQRQLRVLALIAEGRSNAAIATRLSISEKAVAQHTSNIYQQLGLPVSDDDHRRVLAVVQYLAR